MRAMTLPRLGAGAFLSFGILVLWLGACSNGDEACGVNGVKPGICRQSTSATTPTCPSGQTYLPISDPSDECPQSNNPSNDYICCVTPGSGSTVTGPMNTAGADGGGAAATPDAGSKG
jgi:hypothetical protein